MSAIDFSKVTGSNQGTFEPLPEGTYQATVFEIKRTNAKATGNPYYSWTFQVQDPSKYRNRRLFHITMLAPDTALWNLKATLEAILREPLEEVYDVEEHMRDLLGRPVQLQVIQEEYQGQVKNRVRRVQAAPIDFIAGTPADEDNPF